MSYYGWYYRLSQFFRKLFNCRVVKIPIHAGFSCPNRDGYKGSRGCSFCYNPGFSPAVHLDKTVSEQIRAAAARSAFNRKNRRCPVKYLAYFQSYTNTYASPGVLKALFEEALGSEEVAGLSIATRPDCISEEILDYLEILASDYHIWIEYGLQSIHERTLKQINRGHTASQFIEAVKLTQNRGIYIGAHVILGLPGEGREHIFQTVGTLNRLGVDGIKFHHLQVMRHTALEEDYWNGNVAVYSFSEYLTILCDALEMLSPNITIHRLAGETLEDELLVAPHWGVSRTAIASSVEEELLRRRSFQGSAFGR